MALTRVGVDVQWSSSASATVNSTTRLDSDAITFDDADIQGSIQVYATGGTQSGDTLDVYLKQSNGDVKGDTGDDFDTDEHALFLGRLDTFATNTPGENNPIKTFEIPVSAKAIKVSLQGSTTASTRNLTVRARLLTQRG